MKFDSSSVVYWRNLNSDVPCWVGRPVCLPNCRALRVCWCGEWRHCLSRNRCARSWNCCWSRQNPAKRKTHSHSRATETDVNSHFIQEHLMQNNWTHLLLAEVQRMSRFGDGHIGRFEVTQHQQLTANDVVKNQRIKTPREFPFLVLKTHKRTVTVHRASHFACRDASLPHIRAPVSIHLGRIEKEKDAISTETEIKHFCPSF